MKKIISILTSTSLLLAPVSAIEATMDVATEDVIVAQEVVTSPKAKNEPTSEKLEEIIKKVRPLIEVPEEFEEFSWDFNAGSYYSLPTWSLGWTDGETGEVYIRCDNEGRITSYSNYDYNREYGAFLPEKGPDEFENLALEFAKKTSPHIADSEFVLSNVVTASLYNDSYTYRFTRYENGTPVPDNSLSVTVAYKTGIVESYSLSYTADFTFNEKEQIISEEKAKEILCENQNMILSYSLKTEYDEETGDIKERKAYLVYRPEIGYVSVDAYTGEVYTERNTWTVNETGKNMAGSGGGILMDSMATESAKREESAEYELTEKELEQLGVLDSLITKDEAIAIVTGNDMLFIDPYATAVTAHLNKDYGAKPIMLKNEDGTEKEEEQYVWNLTFNAPYDEDKYSYSYMYAVVDANDGTLRSFSASTPDHWYYTENKLAVPELKYTYEQAEKTAFAFIEKMLPEKSKNVRLSSTHDNTPIKYLATADGKSTPVYGVKAFNYTRVNEGVDFTYNRVNTSVDLITGKITNYSYTWYDDVVFESPKDVISPKEALMSLYSYKGFGLNYEINSDYTYNKYLADRNSGKYIDYDELYESETYTRLVYSSYNPGTTIIRAMDGVMINSNGEEYKNKQLYTYDDIEGHWAQDTITRFTYIGVGFEGGKFLPDEKINNEELLNLFNSSRLYERDNFKLAEGNVTRADAVKFIVSALGYYKIACLENVFITDFADNTVLKAEDVGFIAIARGFGLVNGDGDSFRPYDLITRAEALTLIENVIDSGLLN